MKQLMNAILIPPASEEYVDVISILFKNKISYISYLYM